MIVRNALAAAVVVLGFSGAAVAKSHGECLVNGKVDSKITEEGKCKRKGMQWVAKKDKQHGEAPAAHDAEGAAGDHGEMPMEDEMN